MLKKTSIIIICCKDDVNACNNTGINLKSFETETRMINFDEEVAKYQPCLEVDQAEEAIGNNEMTDIRDIVDIMIKKQQNTEYTENQQ